MPYLTKVVEMMPGSDCMSYFLIQRSPCIHRSHKPPEVVVTDVAAGEAGAATSSNGDAGQVAAAVAEVSEVAES